MRKIFLKAMRNFLAALQFMTILPLGRVASFDPVKMMPYFPLVGIFLGVLLAMTDCIAGRFWNPSVNALMDVVFLAVVTGAFHLDGLCDTADGLLGTRSPQSALEIMKDSRLGTMGTVSILCCLALKWGGIAGLESQRTLFLIVVPAYARGSILFGVRFLAYGRTDR